ncbi:phage tail terminator protein [Kozakia baliensis]|uniref:Uncharacterized protein n=1 Tax=Kozakia baliensis TaxID=153496 RepID=A0A1D8UTD4_9PROT|nr:hypothetical protein [Kozakia baliensis]AOX16923.1 hypothetical protein A0U89_06995 [Kozakia baliensis]GBR25574.1 hypothetical protein AA0488_0686 [Kozakia baliensis NRIC 0488]GEL64029.1 hypothetical protein KBA01_13150 [Kozakia baliensis]
MNVDQVIAQIKAYTKFFNHDGAAQVAGAAEAAQVVDKAWLKRPAAYVIALDDAAGDNMSMNGLDQDVEESIAVIVDLDNTPDQRGQFAASTVDQARADLFSCLLNWLPGGANASRGFQYGGGHLIQLDRARLHWQFRFSLKILITDGDGWQAPSEPITEIDATLLDPDTEQATDIKFRV